MFKMVNALVDSCLNYVTFSKYINSFFVPTKNNHTLLKGWCFQGRVQFYFSVTKITLHIGQKVQL